MQVWNKNRGTFSSRIVLYPLTLQVTPQPSTKNLTDEELKQQYGIHLTSRLQTDGEGKEAKWADIDDDDEDDWAPETIEWGDGTKTTVNPADAGPGLKSASTSKPSTPAIEVPKSAFEPKPSTPFPVSIGPNATVLKLGASAERQQAQKAAQQPKGSAEKPPLYSSKTTPAPVPAKSPWAALPPVDRVSPIEITPQLSSQPPMRYLSNDARQQPSNISGTSQAKEMSADDFSRAWRDTSTAQPRELFMPGSGRYESVPESRRRMSRTEQGFRAPAVLQRPGQADPRAPEPSAAFQTNRTSTDVMRRRASSTISGESGQMARRMSIKSGEAGAASNDSAISEGPDLPLSTEERTPQGPTPAYQARGGDYISGPGQTDAEIQAQRAQQRGLMREQAELARKRRQEEEARLEAEKQERIRQKLLSLGPDPKIVKAEEEAKAKAEAEAKAKDETAKQPEQQTPEPQKSETLPDVAVTSAPKPPQPTATGEPQQYGMMKVHPLDTVKKSATPLAQQSTIAKPLGNVQNPQPTAEDISPEPPAINGVKVDPEPGRATSETASIPEPIPRTNRPVAEVRASWGRNDHRPPPAGNLWGVPYNKALGNGTFDQTLAGYAPQDLSSRASSTGQGWMNGKTPTVGQSPQLGHINQHVPETRSQALQNMTSPEPMPLSVNSEVDSMLPVRPPAPIGPPQAQQHQSPAAPHHHMVNGHPSGITPTNAAVAGWNNFHNVAKVQERAEQEQYQRELAARREEEKRTGLRQQANYNFNETFKQVQLGQQPDQRQVNNVAQINMPPPPPPPPTLFGAVGSMPSASAIGMQPGRGSRFFPPPVNGAPLPERRAVTYSDTEVPRSPSPPPAEEYLSAHPVYENVSSKPVIRLPPEKAVVKLPPTPPVPATTTATAPVPTPAPAPAPASLQPVLPPQPAQPLTWAARLSMPAPKPPVVAPLRAVSTPIVQNPSWQERFNGLLGTNPNRKPSDANQPPPSQTPRQSQPALAVTSATKEPLDVMLAGSASVSLPRSTRAVVVDNGKFNIKDVEDEEDLFEDREAGSLPILNFPTDAPGLTWPRPIVARVMPTPPDTQSAFIFLGSHWKEDKYPKQHFAIIRVPGNEKSVKKDLPLKTSGPDSVNGNQRPPPPQPRHPTGSTFRRSNRGGKARPVAAVKAQ